MIRVYNGLNLLFLFIFFFFGCSNKENRRSRLGNDKLDSLALIYDAKKANKRIDAFMQELHQKHGFNGNVLVAKRGKIIYQNAIGWADYPNRHSLEIDSKFELASVSKPLTATAVLMLVERGKIRLKQDVRDFFPNFPYAGITIKMLLTHRSGLTNYVYFVDRLWKSQHKDEHKGISNAEVLKLIAQYKPALYSQPGKKFHYNNSNYMILGAIIEKVTGMSYADFMKANIFIPCGMKNTAVYSKVVYDTIPVKVIGHDRTWQYSVRQNFLDGPVGDKGIYSTIRDLFLFDRALKGGRLLNKTTLDSAYTGRNELSKDYFNYGYGWRLFDNKVSKVAYHTGWWHGFRHIYLRDISSDITIVLLSNINNRSLMKLDELYKIVGMPVIRKNAQGGGENHDD